MKLENIFSEDERAVSEAVSYVLVFGLITAGTALVALQAAPVLDDTRGEQIAKNSERAVLLLQDRMDEMVQQDAPRREVSLDVQDLTVGVGSMEPMRVGVEVTNSSGDTVLAELKADPVFLETTAGSRDQTGAYENGAVLLGQRGKSDSWIMTSRPSWAVTTNSSTGKVRSVFLRTISTRGRSSVGGQRTSARIVLETVSRDVDRLNDITELEISVESPRSGAWEEYFRDLNGSVAGGDVTKSGDTVTLLMDEFQEGEGRINHLKQVIRTEVSAR